MPEGSPASPAGIKGNEDGASTAGVLQGEPAECSTNVPLALKVYQAVRKARAELVQGSAATTCKVLHLADGLEQGDRDRNIMEASKGSDKNPGMFGTQVFQDFM